MLEHHYNTLVIAIQAKKSIEDISNKIISELDDIGESEYKVEIQTLKKLIGTYIVGLQMDLSGPNYSKDHLKRILVELTMLIQELKFEEYGQAPDNVLLDRELQELITLYVTDNPLFKHKYSSYTVLLKEYNKVYQMYSRLNQHKDNKYMGLYMIALLLIMITIGGIIIYHPKIK